MAKVKVKPISARARRALKKKQPKIIEDEKRLLALRGPTTHELAVAAMKDLVVLKKPEAKLLTRKNDIRPMEDATSIEFLAEKNDCAAFIYTSHNKKRPYNLVLGRLFDDRILDMIEMGIIGGNDGYTPLSAIAGPKKMLGAPPLFLFQGDAWDRFHTLGRLQNMLLDVFGATKLTGISLKGIDHIITVTAVEDAGMPVPTGSTLADFRGRIHWRPYFLSLHRSGEKVPAVELSQMGPCLDLVIRRTQFPSPELEKESMKQPAELKKKKVKNVEHDEFGEKHGRIHMERQDFTKLQLRSSKARKAERKGLGKRLEEEDAAAMEQDQQ